MQNKYPFRRDNGEVVWVDFETAMQSSGSLLELDGELLRRAYDLEPRDQQPKSERVQERPGIVSDSLGFTAKALKERVDHLKATGVRGVTFREDPHVKGFYQVVCDSERARNRYAKTLGMADRNSKNGSGAMLSPDQIERAKELLLRN